MLVLRAVCLYVKSTPINDLFAVFFLIGVDVCCMDVTFCGGCVLSAMLFFWVH